MPKGPLKYRELIKKLKKYGVEEIKDGGKGSERMLIKPDTPGGKKGPQIPIKYHGKNTEIPVPVINAVLRRFNITNFWD